MNLKDELRQLLPQKRGRSFYSKRLGIGKREVDRLMEEIRQEDRGEIIDLDEGGKRVDIERGTIESTVISNFEPKNDEELAKLHKVDLKKYKISSYWTKQKGDKFTSSLLCSLRGPSDMSPDQIL